MTPDDIRHIVMVLVICHVFTAAGVVSIAMSLHRMFGRPGT